MQILFKYTVFIFVSLVSANSFSQKNILSKDKEYTCRLSNKVDDLGRVYYEETFYYNKELYTLRLYNNVYKHNVSAIDVVNLKCEGNQVLTAKKYPFKDKSIQFAIKDEYLYIDHINPFDSLIVLKMGNKVLEKSANTFVEKIPNIEVKDYFTGNKTRLLQVVEKNKSDKTIIHFWSTSCPPCIKELPLLKELIRKGYFVVSFCSKEYGEKEKAKEYLKKFNIKVPVFEGGNDEIGNGFNQSGFPTIILFDKKENNPSYFASINSLLEYLKF